MQHFHVLLSVLGCFASTISLCQGAQGDTSTKARKDARYTFDHRLIPYLVYEEPEKFLAAMRSEEAPGQFFSFYQRFQQQQPALPDAGPFDFKAEVRRQFPYEVVLLTYPPPFEPPQVFYSATVFIYRLKGNDTLRTGLRHITLEKTNAVGGPWATMEQPNMLCEWLSTTQRGNFGRGMQELNLDAFYQEVLAVASAGLQTNTRATSRKRNTAGKRKAG